MTTSRLRSAVRKLGKTKDHTLIECVNLMDEIHGRPVGCSERELRRMVGDAFFEHEAKRSADWVASWRRLSTRD